MLFNSRNQFQYIAPLFSYNDETIAVNWHPVGLVWDGSYRILYVDYVIVAIDTVGSLTVSTNGLYIEAGKGLESGSF